jgi:pilus assembly protein CpaC
MRRSAARLCALLLAALLLGAAAPVPVTTAPTVLPLQSVLTIDAGSGRVIQLGGQAASVFAADPKVAEVRPASATSLFVFGIAPGRTTVAAMNAAGAPIAQYAVIVRPSAFGAGEAAAAIARVLPDAAVHIDTTQNGLVARGTVHTPDEADQVMRIVRGYLPPNQKAENQMTVLSATQVNLRVRIAEMSRNVVRALGVNWNAMADLGKYAQIGLVTSNPLVGIPAGMVASTLGAGYNFTTPGHALNINAVIDALAQDQLVRVLAEPNLTAISGQTASFLVGGEFPIPVAQQNNQVTIEFKKYGVSLAFVPTVAADGRITLKVRPEVSALSDQGAVQLSAGNSTIQVPALTVRRAETTVELGSGQSFAIAGLLQDSAKLTGTGLPGLGDIPVLGALFRSDSFQRNETELVIVVTPYLVRPNSNPAEIRLPTDGWKAPNDLDRILLLRQTARGSTIGAAPTHIPGAAGFIVQ